MTSAIPDLVDIVDGENIIIRIVPRAEARGQLNWVSQVILFNSSGKVLVTRRGPNQNFPNYWEFGITETIRHGEIAYKAARRGLEEELLIPYGSQPELVQCFALYYRNPNDQNDKKNVMVYGAVYDGEVKIDASEVVEQAMLTIPQLEKAITEQRMVFTPMNMESWAFYIKAFLGRNDEHSEVLMER